MKYNFRDIQHHDVYYTQGIPRPYTAHNAGLDDKEWDKYKAFHKCSYPFVFFETGEVMVVPNAPHPSIRYAHTAYRLALTSTLERDFAYAMPDTGEPVSAEQLQLRTPSGRGARYLAVDLDTNRAVALRRDLYPQWQVRNAKPRELAPERVRNLPKYMARAAAWAMSADAPLQGDCIEVYRPLPLEEKREYRKWWREFHEMARALATLHGFSERTCERYKEYMASGAYYSRYTFAQKPYQLAALSEINRFVDYEHKCPVDSAHELVDTWRSGAPQVQAGSREEVLAAAECLLISVVTKTSAPTKRRVVEVDHIVATPRNQ